MYKIKDVETRIKNDGVDLGDIGCRFYTEDENTASIRIGSYRSKSTWLNT